VKAWVDAVSIAGSTLRVTAPDPLPAERDTLAVATAIRVCERFPALECLALLGGSGEASLTRADVERLIAPLGFAALRDRGRWPQVLARAVQRYSGADVPDAAAARLLAKTVPTTPTDQDPRPHADGRPIDSNALPGGVP
jgi:hypothetical protein